MDFREVEEFDAKFDLSAFIPWGDFLETPQFQRIEKYVGSLQWWARKHRARLVKEGALWPKQGPGGFLVHPDNMERVGTAIIRDEYQGDVNRVLESSEDKS